MLWLVLSYLWWVWLRPCLYRLTHRDRLSSPQHRTGYRISLPASPMHHRAKPAWVREELLTVAARDPAISCRNLADLFNRRHVGDGMTVGRDLTAKLLKHHRADILLRRHELKRRIYRPGPRNVVWGMDSTGKTDAQKNLHFLLGIVDHGTRHCVTLEALVDKRSVSIVRALCDAIEQHGTPKAIRTDNEAIFQSHVFKTALKWLGIRHQTTELHCPWQNGRIERFFGTLKQKLDRWAVADRASLNASLVAFRLWYNHVRPHQHVQGRTPAEVWDGVDIRRPPRRRL